MKTGIKHLVGCRCILPTMKNRKNPPLHSFIVFSIQDNDEIVEKYATCNNCGIVHRVYDLCKSDVLDNFEGTQSSLTIDDISMMLPESIKNILSGYNKEIYDYEHIKFMIDENKVGDFIVLSSEIVDNRKVGKILKYKGNGQFEIEPFSRSEVV